ncbi:PHD finger protein 3 like protein [Argiope bruennichi]|uniref:PHD finger protein 3 like protein n=1 Tax=Argiope bruennichi TaxID=94029 RepID=A0A8T0FJU3_ARGBR|nr:PHD finger protein 3 like protein [Argiope bruennichi]
MTEKGEKNLLMNVSKDEMNTIDEILQSRQHGVVPERRIIRIPLLSRAFVSGSPKIHFPVRVLIRTGPLRQLTNVQRPSKPVVDTVPSDDESDVDDTSSFEIPERLEDLILLEHNYAVKYSIPLKSKENENAVETKTQETCDIKEVSESSSILEVPEISSILEVRAISGSSEVPAVSGNSDVPAVSGSSSTCISGSVGSTCNSSGSFGSTSPQAVWQFRKPACCLAFGIPCVSWQFRKIPAVSGSSEIPAVSGSSEIPAVSGSSEIPAVSGSSEYLTPLADPNNRTRNLLAVRKYLQSLAVRKYPQPLAVRKYPQPLAVRKYPQPLAVRKYLLCLAVRKYLQCLAVRKYLQCLAVSKIPGQCLAFSDKRQPLAVQKYPQPLAVRNISPPIRRSKRQIEKLERELVSAAKVDALDNEVPKEKLVKHETTNKTDKDTINWNSDIKISNYKCFADFKKRHLKVVIEDCKKAKIENESVSTELSNTNREVKESAEILHDSIIIKSKNESTADEKNIENFKHPESQTRSKYLRKTKLHEPTDLESDDKSNAHGPHAKKKKYLNLIHKSIDSLKSPECEEKSEKSSTENVFKGEKTTEHSQQVNLTNLNKKRKKCILASEKLTNDADIHQIADSPVRKKKKRVSFSEYLLVSDETIPRKQQVVSSDRKESHRKLSVNSPAISITPISKKNFKQGDEEKQTLKEELKQGDEEKQTLKEELKQGDEEKTNFKEELKQGDEEKQTLKEELKQGDEEKQTLKEELKQVDEEKQTLKEELKQVDEEKQTLKEELKQGDKEKQTLKEELKQGDKEKQIVKEELKQGDKELKQDDKLDSKMQTEDGERQMLNQGEKERQILNEEAKERKVFKQDDSKMDLKKTEKQTLKSLEEEELTHKHLEEQCSEEYEEEKHVIRERHYEEKSDSNEENSFHQMHSLTLQDTEGELVINNEMQHSYSNFINIEALLESSKFHATVQEIEEHTSTDSKCINLPTTEVSDNKDHSEEALKHYNDDKLSETVSNTESDNRLSFFTGVNEESKSVPKRKSHRLIKKKEFFGDTSDSSESKKVFATKNKRIKLGKLNGRGRSIRRIKNGINKNDELNGSNDCPEEENSTDFFEEDDPKKLWCICRKPHNSRFMIQCDKCEDWFHGSCVGVTKQYGRQLEKQKKEWNCPNCCSKGEPSPQKVEKSLEQAVDIGNPNQKNLRIDEQDEDVTCENRKDPLLHDVNILNSTNSGNDKMSADDLKNLDSSASDQFPDGEASTNKGRVQFNIEEKLDKISKVRILKHSSQQKRSADFKQNSSTNLKTPDDSSKLSNSSMQSSALNMKSDISLKSSLLTKQTLSNSHNASPNKKTSVANRCSGKPASGFLNPRRKLSNTLKEKDHSVKKKQSCVNCQSEARANSCYCSDDCIEKYAALCLKTMRDAKGGLKGPEFDSQRLVVLDCLKGSLISNENGPTAGEIVSWLKSNPSFIIACSSSMSPSAKKDANSQKKETESNSNSEKTDATNQSAKPTVRLNVRKTLKNILLERVKKSDDLEMAEEDVQKIAVKIEEELNSLFKDNSFKYRAKYRSLMFNIKDPRNQGLFRKILKGNIPPDKLVRMTPEELASLELAKWREQENQHLLDMIKRVQLEQQKNGSVLFLKKTHKGEVEIEDDLTSILEQDLPKPVVKDSSNDLIDTEKEEMKDSTHLHRSHLFDNNCKICTGKIVPPSADENTPKKVRVAHSISVDLGSPNASEGPKVIDGKSPVSSAGDESMDEVPTSTVSESPEINEKSLKDTPSKTLSSVWKGFVHMQDVAKFLTIAYKVSGPTRHLQADLPDTMQICGRIIPDQVWDYLGKIKQSGSKQYRKGTYFERFVSLRFPARTGSGSL